VKETKKRSIVDLQARYNQEMKQKAKFKSSVLKKNKKERRKIERNRKIQ
jgi:inner membrane protein involved in colicin E2 resistance